MDLSKLEKIKTPESEAAENAVREARAYLKSTDWYVIRQIEVGTQIPDEIKASRAEARANILPG